MLELKHLKKYYHVGDTITKALDDVSVAFRKQEFVAILGPSGSGKTTLLNNIGGLDVYDSGDLIIKGKSTKEFKASDWDAYRNNSVGFIFQSYNLIGHLGIIDNVELGMTLSGVSSAEKKERAITALKRVGLEEHMYKKTNQLSGGQMQRVAIARAIANDPEILLCDEPTGALDTETSQEIMQIIKDLSKERLVVMVTHNPELADQYADRIIRFADGKIQSDSDPYDEQEEKQTFSLKKTKMTYWTALKLSFTNIRTKKGRTFLTAFASSIGIIGIAIVLALSNGFQKQIDKTQSNTLAQYPVTISQIASSQNGSDNGQKKERFSKDQAVTAETSEADKAQHANKISQKYVNYVKKLNPKYGKNIGYTYTTGMNLLRRVNGKVKPVQFSNQNQKNANGPDMSSMMANSVGVGVSSYPTDNNGKVSFLHKHYKAMAGQFPSKPTDVVLVINKDNSTNINGLKNLGFNVKNGQKINFNKIVGTTVKAVNNDNYYTQRMGMYLPSNDYKSMYNNNGNKTLRIAGVLRVKSANEENILAPGFVYSDRLTKEMVDQNADSKIVKAQKASSRNILTGQALNGSTAKKQVIQALGGSKIPASIMIYPNTFQNKDKVLSYLDGYNKGKSKADKIIYTDMAGSVSKLTGGLMNAITYVLIAFAAISLVTSMIMISIITYTSVLERTKEIGVLKALGARKKDITRVFDAETAILGVASGVIGIVIAWLATFPINAVIKNLTNLNNVAQLSLWAAVILIIISTVLTIIGGHIPARMASKKDAATALRSE
ncbi:antimicrobial peptide ABC transporter ATP-binding and permease protein [Secundilactobacillus pentosiphilus]|uniref:Antimicrobial peptide ABC transporter ATP-binding and permease protein n=1 Tax=Secundilactobacillus pentosiphilus TaxID=1714682 RepID=A0A1Z5IRT4_9LACO|nr:ABC transporter ATP-binding protein/permease [Secundilactobacillus pentosiphilus]GAX04484.1 antimicrobial peptide ABC transporter ATP-binding and permease protein [Secundilactobacillus pentosiphilus]